MKKLTLFLVILILSSGIAFSQATVEIKEEASTETQVFVDDLGREVVIPANITRIAPSGSNAQVIVFQIAPEKLVGLSTKLSA
ncbi:MAG: ABC transporter substrate-binding protein, partial [Spirochaetales bacterium]|nr:ABC transporter substrate-binding protein [Spirochaetales bacterium]